MVSRNICRWRRLFLLFLSLLFIAACGEKSTPPDTRPLLEQIRGNGKLVILTTNEPTAYYFDRDDKPAGPEYEMTRAFAESLGVEPDYRVFDSLPEVIDALRRGEGHIAAAGITITEERQKEFDFGPSYQTVSEELICYRNSKRVGDTGDIAGLDIVIPAQSSYIRTLKKLQAKHPNIEWRTDDRLLTPQLMKKVWKKQIQCTVADSTIVAINRRYYPELSVKYTLANDSHLAWMLPKNSPQLKRAVTQWFEEFNKFSALDHLLEKYYGFVEVFDYVDIKRFLRRIDERYPKYRAMFETAAKEQGISPTLLAAVSYQESHWDPRAKSPTGVRGMMMLTQPVARSLGVTSRLDAEQNIFAGAVYLRRMLDMVGEEVPEPDRTWLALAAYNVGRGHFRDAQGLARRLGKNPQRWADMKEVLPLLSQKAYYKDLRYGYARGNEPVRYVTRIRDYRDLLEARLSNEGIPGQKRVEKPSV
ncbi:MAG TPA: membrane-bound lytic murein transglycosylase MltF [Gammaproteobacteria bacterium]|nr:membrane-bound lytic murein transglycosylase MltF [Gammaproteobacteria bacterium]